ncbi:MAG: hypothetical protein D6748_16100, partial [Calditrichaeota bacterium]
KPLNFRRGEMNTKQLFRVIFALTTFFTLTVAAQFLPEGRYHTNRERDIDILHYKAQLELDIPDQSLRGSATITLTPLHATHRFSLDAVRLDIQGCSIRIADQLQTLPFEVGDDKVFLQLPSTYHHGDTITVQIDYQAHPTAGMYFVKDPSNKNLRYVYTYGEGGLHANWLPIYNDVNDKFTSELIVTVPLPYRVISNGILVATEEVAGQKRLFHWKETKPHSNYLIVLYAGNFEKGDLPSAANGTPLHFWVPKGRLEEGAYSFRNTPEMVNFFSERFNYPYPWEKYDQIAVPDYSIGAMEHTTATGHRASVLRNPNQNPPDNFGPDLFHYYNIWTADGTISHELAHHWFGDNLTCRNLSMIWLNESFATYCQMLWDENAHGKGIFYLDRLTALDRYLEFVKNNHLIRPLEYHQFDLVSDIYTQEITYFKGALVLHFLRYLLGDEAFFRMLSDYLHKHEFSNVDSHDFQIAIEEATGQNLDWFFDDWIYNGGYPILEVESRYIAPRKITHLVIRQVQSIVEGQDFFTLPVEVTIVTANKTITDTLWIDDREEEFFIPTPGKPQMISLDRDGVIIGEIHFPKSASDLVYQIEHDHPAGKIRALRQLLERYPYQSETARVLEKMMKGEEEWWVKAEIALRLGKLPLKLQQKLLRRALNASDYHIRKAAVLGLQSCSPELARKTLRTVISKDSHGDVVATAIIVLSKFATGKKDIDFITAQLNRPSWYEEINLACMRAFENIASPELVKIIQPYSNYPHNQFVRNAALDAWAACKPDDPQLHHLLKRFAMNENYGIVFHAIELLGDIPVVSAAETLEEIAITHGDPDVRLTAEQALVKIEKLEAVQ